MLIDTRKTYIASFWVSLIIAIGLMVTGFFMPPKGKIDGSVLEGTGIIFLWPALAFGAKALEEGKTATFTHNNTQITVGEKEEK